MSPGDLALTPDQAHQFCKDFDVAEQHFLRNQTFRAELAMIMCGADHLLPNGILAVALFVAFPTVYGNTLYKFCHLL
jgi:hypothetical protein